MLLGRPRHKIPPTLSPGSSKDIQGVQTAAADGSDMKEAEYTAEKLSQNIYPKMLLLP